MNTRNFVTVLVKSGCFPVSVAAGPAADEEAFFGGDSDVEFAQALWVAMEKYKLVGEGAINAYPFAGNEPHGVIQQVFDADISVNGRSARVNVKKNHDGKDMSVKSVYADPVTHLKAVTVMFKRDDGYTPENLDRFWAKYTPTGKVDKNPQGAKHVGSIGKDRI